MEILKKGEHEKAMELVFEYVKLMLKFHFTENMSYKDSFFINILQKKDKIHCQFGQLTLILIDENHEH